MIHPLFSVNFFDAKLSTFPPTPESLRIHQNQSLYKRRANLPDFRMNPFCLDFTPFHCASRYVCGSWKVEWNAKLVRFVACVYKMWISRMYFVVLSLSHENRLNFIYHALRLPPLKNVRRYTCHSNHECIHRHWQYWYSPCNIRFNPNQWAEIPELWFNCLPH